MNIDISNAHCGPRIQFLDHAWLRVAHVNLRLLALRVVPLYLSLSVPWCLRQPAVVLTIRRTFQSRRKRTKKDTNKSGRERTYATYERLLDARRRSSRSCRDRAIRTHARYINYRVHGRHYEILPLSLSVPWCLRQPAVVLTIRRTFQSRRKSTKKDTNKSGENRHGPA